MQTSIENNNSVILNNNQQEIDASIPLNYYLNINTTSSPFLKQYSKDAQFAKVEDNKVIYRLVNYFKIPSISQIPAKIQFCIKAGFHDSHNNKGFSARHIIARNHLEKIHNHYRLSKQYLSLVQFAQLIMKNIEGLINEGQVALAYARNEKALVFASDIRNNNISTLQYVLATFYIDSISETFIRFAMGTLYEIPRYTYELIKYGNERYLPVISYEKIIQITAPTVEPVLANTYQQLEVQLVNPKLQEPVVFDEGMTYPQLIYKDAVDISFQDVDIKIEEHYTELNSMVEEDFQKFESLQKSIKKFRQAFEDYINNIKEKYLKIKNLKNASEIDIYTEFTDSYLRMRNELDELNKTFPPILSKKSELFSGVAKSLEKLRNFPVIDNIILGSREADEKFKSNDYLNDITSKVLSVVEILSEEESNIDIQQCLSAAKQNLNMLLIAYLRLANVFLNDVTKNGMILTNPNQVAAYLFIKLLKREEAELRHVCEENKNLKQFEFFTKKLAVFDDKYPEINLFLRSITNNNKLNEIGNIFVIK